MSTTTQFTQTWHKHDGGPCPVDPMTRVVVMDGMQSLPHAAEATLWDWEEITAYTTDIFDGVFPEFGRLVPVKWATVMSPGCATDGGEVWDVALENHDHIPDAGKNVEPTRGAGCENEILP